MCGGVDSREKVKVKLMGSNGGWDCGRGGGRRKGWRERRGKGRQIIGMGEREWKASGTVYRIT